MHHFRSLTPALTSGSGRAVMKRVVGALETSAWLHQKESSLVLPRVDQ